mmetsp:Transcript_1105/g.2311  ORF Transcript_1105/g.2311 Transcript_1105/m.2311 type:complete len:128 (+) Transcript_1105:82-465(+)
MCNGATLQIPNHGRSYGERGFITTKREAAAAPGGSRCPRKKKKPSTAVTTETRSMQCLPTPSSPRILYRSIIAVIVITTWERAISNLPPIPDPHQARSRHFLKHLLPLFCSPPPSPECMRIHRGVTR